MIIIAMAMALSTPAQLYWQCRRQEKSCADFVTSAAASTPDLCMYGNHTPESSELIYSFMAGLERHRDRLSLSAEDAVHAAIHDVSGCMDDHARHTQRDYDNGYRHP